MSDDSHYFLFEDQENKKFTVYSLETSASDTELKFDFTYDIALRESKVITDDIFNYLGDEDPYSEFSMAVKSGSIKLSIDCDGNVLFIKCKPELIESMDSESLNTNGDVYTQMMVLGCRFYNTLNDNSVDPKLDIK